MIYKAIKKNLDLASRLILSGEIIVYPTDTIYGFGVDATNSEAINKLNALKNRISPLSITVDSEEMIRKYVNYNFNFSNKIKGFLPGAYTILLKNKNKFLPKEIGLDTGKIGVRIPDSKFIIQLVRLINKPIVTTSVNVHNSKPLNDINMIYEKFNSINIFSNGINIDSKGSTILDCTSATMNVLRQGDGII